MLFQFSVEIFASVCAAQQRQIMSERVKKMCAGEYFTKTKAFTLENNNYRLNYTHCQIDGTK